jgi:hypothetical protein
LRMGWFKGMKMRFFLSDLREIYVLICSQPERSFRSGGGCSFKSSLLCGHCSDSSRAGPTCVSPLIANVDEALRTI